MSVGIICEYNPFHNGHIYHLNEVKKRYPNEKIILVLGGNFLQRGNLSIINKYDKTKIALQHGVNLVVELPFSFASQGADLFAKGAISILNILKCDKIVFGSETADIDLFTKLASLQLNSNEYDSSVKKYLDSGVNYPTALSLALKDLGNYEINMPNDILALAYIKEIKKENLSMIPIAIKRTNNYHDKVLGNNIASATSIRKAIYDNRNIEKYVPNISYELINKTNYKDNYFKYLKYKIITEKEKINRYQTVDEGVENRIVKNIYKCNCLDDLVNNIKTKRYTYNRINRMLTHIICSFTKEEAKDNVNIKYIRILGFDEKGKSYINKIKKEISIPIITNINKNNINYLDIEIRCDCIYNLIMNNDCDLFSSKPIIKP